MKLIGNILYLEYQEMVDCGVSEGTLLNAKYRQSNSWRFIDDPADRRRVLIGYEDLKPQYKDLVNAKYGNPYDYIRFKAIKELVKPVPSAFKFFVDYINPATGKTLPTQNPNYPKAHKDYVHEYTRAAEWLTMLTTVKLNKELLAGLGMESRNEFYEACVAIIKAESVDLPHNYARLRDKIRKYEADGFRSLISNKFGNQNTLKITDEIGEWLIAQYQLPIKIQTPMLALKYLHEAQIRNWPSLTENAIYQFLHKPEVIQLWYGGRHGHRAATEAFGYQLRTEMPTFRDALWYSDGTGLNYVGRKNDKAQWLGMHNMYFIIDAFSDFVVGWHLSKTENYEAQVKATQMAVRTSMAKPYEWRYDGQGGHGKGEVQEFFDKVARVHFNTQPYNGKSKTIENLFNRFQQQTMRQDWFFSGQNRTATSKDSKANMEFILENFKQAPTLEEIHAILAQRIEQWNNGIHHKYGIPRRQLYFSSTNPHHQPVDYLEMVEMFWLTSTKPITYRNAGIEITISNNTYEFEVLQDGMPDEAFRANNIGARFFVKYDPDEMGHIRLYTQRDSGSLQFVAIAQPRITVPRAIVDHKPGDRERIDKLIDHRKKETKRMRDTSEAIAENTGIRAKDLVTSYGQYLKQQSNEQEPALIALYGSDYEEGKALD